MGLKAQKRSRRGVTYVDISETQTVAALPTQTVPTQVDDQDVRSWSSGPKRTQSWKKLLPESTSSAISGDLTMKIEVLIEALLTDVRMQPADDRAADDPNSWCHLKEE
ncbi:unnamed protein product [Leuciscus chuanchicus]